MSSVRDFGAQGDGIADDTAALQHAIDDGDGFLLLPRGDYRITRPLEIDLARGEPGPLIRRGLHGAGGTARIIMDAAGPAIRITGTHRGNADPRNISPQIGRAHV